MTGANTPRVTQTCTQEAATSSTPPDEPLKVDPVIQDQEPGVLIDPHGLQTGRECGAEAPGEIVESPAIAASLPEVVEVLDLDWIAVRKNVDPSGVRSRIREIVERMETLLDQVNGPGLLFDSDRSDPDDRAITISVPPPSAPWIIGDLHGDLLALEAALALMRSQEAQAKPYIVFLGDLFDDEGFGLEVLLRVFELILEAPSQICLIAGNHDEALVYDGVRFASSVDPSDFASFLNANLAHEWIERAGKLAVRIFARAPRALFFGDGLLVAHGGFPLSDLHQNLTRTLDWNDPACLSDFVWTRCHPKARKKLPNRYSRGSQYGFEDFARFCELSRELGRPVNRMVRGHDHVEDRYAVYPAYRAYPVLTTVALSRRLPRESVGPFERAATIARYIPNALPTIYRLHIPDEIIREVYHEALAAAGSDPVPTEAQP